MDNRFEKFIEYLNFEGKSENTIKTYESNMQEYVKWFIDTYDVPFSKVYRANIFDYKTYLLNVKKYRGKNLNARTVNSKLSALVSFNKFLVGEGVQAEIVINKNDFVKVQMEYANPCEINKRDVEHFRQNILETGDQE